MAILPNRWKMMYLTLCWLLLANCAFSSQKIFSVTDDIFAYPQYEIDFSSTYILEDDAAARFGASKDRSQIKSTTLDEDFPDEIDFEYEQMTLHGRRYLCSIPRVGPSLTAAETTPSEEDEKKELTRAADRGWQLLQDMESGQCLYYSTGWWSYAFCYNSYVKQFHALPPTPGGARSWPPSEDQATPSYILGQVGSPQSRPESVSDTDSQNSLGLQTRADGNYLVQRLEGGTPCDLTGKNRRVEIEFHCHPQTTDHIGWIKETTTCAYVMVVYTPRLCNDVAFQPPRESQAHTISCQEILTLSEAAHLHENQPEPVTLDESAERPVKIGKIELGAMKHLGNNAAKLEKGSIVMTPDEKAEIIIMKKDGQVQSISKAKLKELKLESEEIEEFKKELQRIAGSNDWKIEKLEHGDGQIHLRGIVSEDKVEGEDAQNTDNDEDGEQKNENEQGHSS